MSTVDKKATRISVSLDDQDYRELALIAKNNGVSISWVIRRAIGGFLDQHRETLTGQFPLNLRPPE